jgi:hypothetical protein
MSNNPDRWARFRIRFFRHPAADDARRVVFELADPGAGSAASRPATVVLRAGGELLVQYDPPQPGVPGLGRDDYLQKAAAIVRAMPG